MSIQAKRKLLLQWLQQWVELPPQGSDKWYESRLESCGGSELKRLLCSEKEFVAQKCGISSIPTIIAMTWGSVFETVSRQVSQILFQTEVYESSSIPSIEHPRKTYSLDGIGLVGLRGTCAGHNVRAWLYTLFEYKNLWSRKPQHGSVFPEYLPQVKSGMADLGIPEIAIYMEQVVRICTLKQMQRDDSSHNEVIHKPSTQLPIGCGCLLIYVKVPVYEIKSVPSESLWSWIRRPGRDIGDISSQSELHDILLAIKSGFFQIELSPIHINGERLRAASAFIDAQKIDPSTPTRQAILKELQIKANEPNDRLVGILPYKLMDMNIVPVQKEVGYTARHGPAIDAAMERVHKLRSITDDIERWYAYVDMYSEVKTRRSRKVFDDLGAYALI